MAKYWTYLGTFRTIASCDPTIGVWRPMTMLAANLAPASRRFKATSQMSIDTVVVILSDWRDASAEMIENMKKWPGVVFIRLLL